MKKIILTLFLLYAGIAYGQVSIGIRIGPPPPARIIVAPVQPGSDYYWIDGYWYPNEGNYMWHNGYWTRPPYSGARWIGPRHDGKQYFNGYWEGSRGQMGHDHRWDNDRGRDFHHEQERGRDHERRR